MPVRGSLFRKVQQLKRARQKSKARKLQEERIRGELTLFNLRKTRFQEERKATFKARRATARATLRKDIATEKARIARAKGPTKIGRIESFLAREAKKGAKIGLKEARKRVKIQINTGGTKRRKKRKTGKRKR